MGKWLIRHMNKYVNKVLTESIKSDDIHSYGVDNTLQHGLHVFGTAVFRTNQSQHTSCCNSPAKANSHRRDRNSAQHKSYGLPMGYDRASWSLFKQYHTRGSVVTLDISTAMLRIQGRGPRPNAEDYNTYCLYTKGWTGTGLLPSNT